MRCGRATLRFTAPASIACVWPGWSAGVVRRFSWQPPHTRCSPARPLIQIDSLATLIANLSINWMWKGTLPGTEAANELSACSGISA